MSLQQKREAKELWEHFYLIGNRHLEKCSFSEATKNYHFSLLSPDLPEQKTDYIKEQYEKASLVEKLNDEAKKHYSRFNYADAKNKYKKILRLVPQNELIIKRIWYCENPVFSYNNLQFIKGGEFIMGDSSEHNNYAHKVIVPDFYLNKYEVTNEEYAEFLNIYGSDTVINGHYHGRLLLKEKDDGLKKEGLIWKPYDEKKCNYPAIQISWYGALEFCIFWKGVLPTEAFWEFAASSRGKNVKYSWGNEEPFGTSKKFKNVCDEAYHEKYPNRDYIKGYNDGFIYSSPVGYFEPNELGLHDMSGNIWEWCSDWYDRDYYKVSPEFNPQGAEKGEQRVLRGSSWYHPTNYCRIVSRFGNPPENCVPYFGFRFCKLK